MLTPATSSTPAPVAFTPAAPAPAAPAKTEAAAATPPAAGDQNDVTPPAQASEIKPVDLNDIDVPPAQYADNGGSATTSSGGRGRG
jgi:hypothetical protein